jgi:hypothetical protein
MKYWPIFLIGLFVLTACATEPVPTCRDGIQNADEQGVDCGGIYCKPCFDYVSAAQCEQEKESIRIELTPEVVEEEEEFDETSYPFDRFGCYDSDGGPNQLVEGFAIHRDGTRAEDVCQSEFSLREAYCDPYHIPNHIILNCDYLCRDSVCITATPDGSRCYDFDGDDPNTASNIILVDGTEKRDYCKSSFIVREYLCNDFDQSTIKDYDCAENLTCVDGACI